MRARRRLPHIFLATCFLTVFLASPTAGSDDSNSQDLSKIPIGSGSGTVSGNNTSILSTLDELSEGVGDAEFEELLTQFESQVRSGNNAEAALTLSQLQVYIDSPEGRNLSVSLKDVVKSLSVGPGGLSLNTDLLKSLIGNFDPSLGMPTGMAGMDPVQASRDLSVLSNGLRGIDPSLANGLSHESFRIDQLLSSGFFPGKTSSGKNDGLKPPGLSSTGLNPPGIVPINLSTAALSPLAGIPGLPASPADLKLLIPILLVVVVACALFLRRGNLSGLLSKRVFPSPVIQPESDEGLNRHNPRDLIILYFRKAVRLMWRRGIPRLHFETHREFSDKCSERPEGPHVGGISGLYERAMFSGREVTMTEAGEAGRLLEVIEKSGPKQREAIRRAGSNPITRPTSAG